jgi:hypothetical protein
MPAASFKLSVCLLMGVITVVVICLGTLGVVWFHHSSLIVDANYLLSRNLSQETLAIVPSGQNLRHPQLFNPKLSFRYAPQLPYGLLEPGRLFFNLPEKIPIGNGLNADSN